MSLSVSNVQPRAAPVNGNSLTHVRQFKLYVSVVYSKNAKLTVQSERKLDSTGYTCSLIDGELEFNEITLPRLQMRAWALDTCSTCDNYPKR